MSSVSDTTFQVPVKDHLFYRATGWLHPQRYIAVVYSDRLPADKAFSPHEIWSLDGENSGVTLKTEWDSKLMHAKGVSFEIDVAKLDPCDIAAGKVHNVHYKMHPDDGCVGEIRFPVDLPPNVVSFINQIKADARPANPNDVVRPIKGYLFCDKCWVSNHRGIVQEELAPDFFVENWAEALHESENRVSLSADKRHITIHFDRLTPEELQNKQIKNVRYCWKGTPQFTEQDERKVDGRYGHIDFDETDIPVALRGRL